MPRAIQPNCYIIAGSKEKIITCPAPAALRP